jgi:3-oxoadipate enol-lactonase
LCGRELDRPQLMRKSLANSRRRTQLIRAFQVCLLFAFAVACGRPPSAVSREPGAAVDTGRVAVPGSSLYYEAAGAGTPVILLHAGYLDRRMWDNQFLLFARSYRVIRYDARGLGRSGPADTPYSSFEDLYALIRALKLTRVTLIGASLGGAASLDLAVTHPELVEKLVLVGPGLSGYAWPPEDLNQRWRVEARAALAQADTVGVALAWAHSGYLLPASEQAPVAAKLRTLLADNVGFWKGVLRHPEGYDTAPSPPTLNRLAAVRAPALLIVGSRDLRDIHQIVDTLRQRLPNARTIVFREVGHLPSMEQPDRFSATVLDFLRMRRFQ